MRPDDMLLYAALRLTAVDEKQMRKAIGFRCMSPYRILLEGYCYGYVALTYCYGYETLMPHTHSSMSHTCGGRIAVCPHSTRLRC